MARNLDKLPFDLTNNESIIQEFPRSKIPYLFILFLTLLSSSFFFLTFIAMFSGGSSWIGEMLSLSKETSKGVAPVMLAVSAMSVLAGIISAYVYSANRMFLTNEHIVRIKQDGLVATDKKFISHLNIEDIKARQNIIGAIFGYGLLTMSTEGQNATYEINFIVRPFEMATLATDIRDQYQQSVIEDGGRSIPLAEKR